MSKDNLGDRMKRYEKVPQNKLITRTPVIVRLDGKSFHTLTRGMVKPFDDKLIDTMNYAALEVCKQISGCKLAYVQSDEISLLITDFEKFETQAWFDYKVQKLCSVTASMASTYFNWKFMMLSSTEDYITMRKLAVFDSRCFNLSTDEVCNYFVWRQQDCIRNSISMVAQANFSPKQLHGVSGKGMKGMLLKKGIDWDEMEGHKQRGTVISYSCGEWFTLKDAALFTSEEGRKYINNLVKID